MADWPPMIEQMPAAGDEFVYDVVFKNGKRRERGVAQLSEGGLMEFAGEDWSVTINNAGIDYIERVGRR